MKLTDFIGRMNTGFARTNRYYLEFNLPPMLQAGHHVSDVEKMQLLCDSVQLPGLNLNTAQIRTFGEIREMPYEMNYEPITLSFYVDGDMIVKGIWDDWVKSIQQGRSRVFNYYDTYVTDMKIVVQNLEQEERDQGIFQVKLYEAYPKTVNAVQLSYEQKDIMKVTVTLMYKYWESTTQAELEQPPANAPTPSPYLAERQGVVTNITTPYINNSYNMDDMTNIVFKNG